MTRARPKVAVTGLIHGFAGLIVAAVSAGCASTAPLDDGVFFDDFSQPDLAALGRDGWTLRETRGHPGIAGAAWGAASIELVADPALPGNRLLRLSARTDGTPQGTAQAQICHARKYLNGTSAARVRFSDAPVQGPDGDIVVQTFFAAGPLKFDFDPDYSELDWEYLPNGGWGDARTRLYAVSWQTVRIEPWLAFNQPHEAFRSMDGWHVLMMQVDGGRTRWFVDGELRAEHGGRNAPVVPMALSFSEWFSPGGQLAGVSELRRYTQDVDWVFHARGRVLSPSQLQSAVEALRRAGTSHVDGVPPAAPPLPSPCDF